MIHCYKDYNQALSGLKRIEYNIPCNNPNLSNTLSLENHNGVPMLHFRKLKDFPWLYQGFSTRIGGVSSGIFADPVNRVFASLLSGWRGTVGNIARNAVDIMKKNYGCHASDLYGFIGPGICPDCYEVSSDVAGKFAGVYSNDEMALILQNGRTEGKFQLNLLMANRINLINAGLADSNIFTADICTCCNPKLLFSHRASEGKRGLMCNFIYLKGV